jgi:hypothetical protein
MRSEILERIDPNSGIDALGGLIEKAKLLLQEKPFQLADYAKWNETTRDCLIKIYGPESPNIFSIVECSCDDGAWSDMAFGNHKLPNPEKITERYAAACLEARCQRLANCITALKANLKESSPPPA